MFHSKWGVLGFQAEGVALAMLRKDLMLVWSTGLGKSIGGAFLSSLLTDDESVDVCFIVCEGNKVDEWIEDIEGFTDLSVKSYQGTPKKREGIRDEIAAGLHDVVVASYETMRNDLSIKAKGRGKRKRLGPGPLHDLTTGLRVAVIYDEISAKFRARTSWVYKAHHAWVSALRRASGSVWVLGLTATPLERDAESFFNQMRIVSPEVCPTVEEFERDYVNYRDDFGRVRRHMNLTSDDSIRMPDVVPLSERFSKALHIKNKSDPDVASQFPEPAERFEHVPLLGAQRALYDAISDLNTGEDPAFVTVLRQAAVLPQALLVSESETAQQIVEAVGADLIQSMPSAKVDRLVEILHQIVDEEGEQVVVFSHYGPSILPAVERRLSAEGLLPTPYHGAVSKKLREANKAAFKAGQARVLLSSDAGSRGINLPEASYVINLDPPTTHCLPAEARVQTPSGPVMIRDLNAGNMVWSLVSGKVKARPVIAQAKVGRNRLHRVTMTRGCEITATSGHPVLVRVPGTEGGDTRPGGSGRTSVQWRTLSEVQVGDHLVQPTSLPDPGMGTAPDGTPVTPDMAQWLGAWMGDGSLTPDGVTMSMPERDRAREHYEDLARTLFTCREDQFGTNLAGDGITEKILLLRDEGLTYREVAERLGVTISVVSGRLASHRRSIRSRRRAVHVVDSGHDSGVGRVSFRFNSREARDQHVRWGFEGHATTKRIPGWVFSLRQDLRLNFIAGLVDSDGHVNKGGALQIGFASRLLTEDVRDLLLSVGITAGRITHRDNPAFGGGGPTTDFWSFTAGSAGAVASIPFVDPLYRERVKGHPPVRTPSRSCASRAGIKDARFVRVIAVEDTGVDADVYDIAVSEGESFITGGVIVHNSTYMQRINRIHRLGAGHDYVYAHTLIASDTIEESLVNTWMTRNRWSDQMMVPGSMTAEERRAVLEISSSTT